MTETREIHLNLNEDEYILLSKTLDFTAHEKPARQSELAELDAKIGLAWTERKDRTKE